MPEEEDQAQKLSTDALKNRNLKKIYRYAPYALLTLLVIFSLRVRLLGTDSVIRQNDVLFSGNDPWYHARIIQWTVQHFPSTPPYEPWTYFPFGQTTPTGFGGLYDQIIAFAAILIGGGNPSPHTVEVVTAMAPAVFGAATLIPLYLVIKKLTDKWIGVLAVVIVSFISGSFLVRTLVGSSDHQSAEAFFGTLAVAGVFYMVTAVKREKPTLAHVRDLDWHGLKRPLLAGFLGGVAVALYLMMWSPGVMLVFVFGVFVILQMIKDHYEGNSTEYLAFGVLITFFTATVLTLLYANQYTLSHTRFSLLQPLTTFGVAVGGVFIHWLSSSFSDRDYPWYFYPGTIGGLLIAGIVLSQVVFPEGIDMLWNLVTRIYSFGIFTSPTALTVQEIQPPTLQGTFRSYSFLLLLAMGGAAAMIYRVIDGNRPLELLTLLWSYTMFSAYFTMARFGYYFAINVVVLASFFVWWSTTDILELDKEYMPALVGLILVSIVVWLGLTNLTNYPIIVPLALLAALIISIWLVNEYLKNNRENYSGVDLETYKIIFVILMVFLITLSSSPVWAVSSTLAGGANIPWQNELKWMNNNTPNEPLEFYGSYNPPEDMDYDYPVDESPIQGSYGVMSWWDYGHWITYTGQRIPDANPFQQGQIPSADFLTSVDEERAELILEALPSVQENISNVDNMSTTELREIVENQGRQERYEDTRYVMIDDQMAAGKFGAIATWMDESLANDYLAPQEFNVANETVNLLALNSRYKDTMLSQLYFGDAAGLEHYRLVHETERYSFIGSIVNMNTQRPVRVNRLLTRTSYNGNLPGTTIPIQQIGRLPQTQTIRGGGNNYIYDFRVAASVKTFERVNGAELVGQTQNATNVTTLLRLETTNTNRSFLYRQQVETNPNGTFSITVPYPTENTISTSEGGTDEGVRSVGNYTVYAGGVSIINFQGRQRVAGQPTEVGRVDVTEEDIYMGNEVEVDLEEFTRNQSNATAGG